MRGPDAMQESLFTLAKLDDFVPADHPLRAIRVLVNEALAAMNTRFNQVYADTGRDSIAFAGLVGAAFGFQRGWPKHSNSLSLV